MPSSKLVLMEMWLRWVSESGLEKKRIFPSSGWSWARMLAIQLGSISAFREEECSVHVLPRSWETATERPLRESFRWERFLSSLMFNIKLPSVNSTTCASVVSDFAPVRSEERRVGKECRFCASAYD